MAKRLLRHAQGAESPTCLVKCILLGSSILTCLPPAVFSMKQATVSSGRTEKGVSLNFEVEKTEYGKKDGVLIRFRVENKQKEDIYLVVGEAVTPGYELNRKELAVVIYKTVLTYHYFTYPKLERIKPGNGYQAETNLPLEFLGKKFSTGKWLLYLSIGYLNARRTSEMTGLLKKFGPDGLAKEFEQRQELLGAGPIEIELIE
jgi:hypothetical protein